MSDLDVSDSAGSGSGSTADTRSSASTSSGDDDPNRFELCPEYRQAEQMSDSEASGSTGSGPDDAIHSAIHQKLPTLPNMDYNVDEGKISKRFTISICSMLGPRQSICQDNDAESIGDSDEEEDDLLLEISKISDKVKNNPKFDDIWIDKHGNQLKDTALLGQLASLSKEPKDQTLLGQLSCFSRKSDEITEAWIVETPEKQHFAVCDSAPYGNRDKYRLIRLTKSTILKEYEKMCDDHDRTRRATREFMA